MDKKHELLERYFGYSSFREGQEQVVDAILSGRDAFAIMPTGGGKSLCFQLPALMLPGLTVVISPLISLMKDQVMALRAMGIQAAFINSSLTTEEYRAVCAGLRDKMYRLLYVAPERLELEGFLSVLSGIDISLVAVDEAHCISQWGQDFRPSYLKIPDFISRLRVRPPVAAFTATATEKVRSDVERLLSLRSPLRVTTGFDRPNLYFEVIHPDNKFEALLKLLSPRRQKSGIIYCSTRKTVETLCEKLVLQGFPATRYHAGLEDSERRQNQEDFIYDRRTVMVATNAFGMGIDKSNVGYVIHYNMPKTLEEYYQEAGRAGRDGERADCVLLYNLNDVRIARILISNSNENPELSDEERRELIARDYERLERMIGYCEARTCYRGYILEYFGQPHGDTCHSCGNCSVPYSRREATREAQMVLSCMVRVHERLGYYVGQGLITRILLGSRDKRIRQLGLEDLSTYGLMRGQDKAFLRLLFAGLEDQGYIVKSSEHGAVSLTSAAKDVLFRGKRVEIPVRDPSLLEPKAPKKPVPAPMDPEDMDDDFNELLSALKMLRMRFARAEGVPLYIVFTNATLTELARRRPETMEELQSIPGIGSVKAQRFGQELISVIRAHRKNP